MQYYVVAPDGQKYGPADVATLAQWAQEGRLDASTILESALDATRIPASSVPGIISQANPYAQPAGQAAYARPMGAYDDGSSDVTKAWVFGAIGFFCCPIIFSVMGIVYGNNAVRKGHPGGRAAMTFSIVTLVAGIIFGVVLNLSRFAALSR